jgi:DNA repair protein RecO (recombination protein O)
MPDYSSQILVLKKTKLGETDLIITGFSHEGHQVRAVVKGGRRPGSKLGTHLELYAIARVLLHKGRNLDVVSEAQTVSTNDACRQDVKHSAGAAVIVELLDKMSSDADADERLFPLATEALRCIGSIDEEGIMLITAAAVLKIAAQCGFRPSLTQCISCGTERHEIEGSTLDSNPDSKALSFSFEQGGIICDRCLPELAGETVVPVNAQLIEWAEALITSRFVDLLVYANAEYEALGRRLLEFSREWVRFHLVPRLKSLDFLLSFE